MALQSIGPISFSQIQAEFGGNNPISLSEYYAGGNNVPNDTFATNGTVPVQGSSTIKISNFYGLENQE